MTFADLKFLDHDNLKTLETEGKAVRWMVSETIKQGPEYFMYVLDKMRNAETMMAALNDPEEAWTRDWFFLLAKYGFAVACTEAAREENAKGN